MAGIFDRMDDSGESRNRISGNLLHAGFVLRATGDFTPAQVLAGLNAQLALGNGDALAGAEITDLSALDDQLMISRTSSIDRLVYATKLRAIFVATEEGAITDATFRSVMGIS